MADIKKFLDKKGVSTLWTRIAEELEAKQTAIDAVKTAAETNKSDITTMKGQIAALEAGTYDDAEVRGLINTNKTNIQTNTDAIAVLNGEATVAGSIKNTATAIAAEKVAEIVAGADASYDTLKEIADWILSDTTGAAGLANDVSALKGKLEGVDTTVVAAIASAIDAALKTEGVDKYALATDLTALATRVKALEDAGYQNAAQVGNAIDAKITALKLAETYDTKGAADTALTKAKTYSDSNLQVAKGYTDTEIEKIQALTEAEIQAAINEAANAE